MHIISRGKTLRPSFGASYYRQFYKPVYLVFQSKRSRHCKLERKEGRRAKRRHADDGQEGQLKARQETEKLQTQYKNAEKRSRTSIKTNDLKTLTNLDSTAAFKKRNQDMNSDVEMVNSTVREMLHFLQYSLFKKSEEALRKASTNFINVLKNIC